MIRALAITLTSAALWLQVAFAAESALPLPTPQNVPTPGPQTGAAYAPRAILPGGVVIPLYPPNATTLRIARLPEPEAYKLWAPDTLGSITNIHNPSIEFHPGNNRLNTGAAVVLVGGGGHSKVNVGEALPLVQFLANQGVSSVLLRYRLRSDGYEPKVQGVQDALQAIKLVRAYAKEWKLDQAKIGIMGFSAGGELAMNTGLLWEEYDRTGDMPANALAKVSSRPDFIVGLYPARSLFSGGSVRIPRAMPPVFLASAGQNDWPHAYWAGEFYRALLMDGVPNIELILYARGRHPGDKNEPGEPPSTGGITNMGGIPFGTWSQRFLDWFRDLGFLQAPGIETLASRDVAASLSRRPRAFPADSAGLSLP